jgi:molecular chaperone GrpE
MSAEQKDFDLEREIETGQVSDSTPDNAGDLSAEGISSAKRKEENLAKNLNASELLDQQLAQLKSEVNKYKETALRSVADLDNYRKRMAREKEDAIRYANATFLERLIPILDNFELGLQAAKARGNGGSAVSGQSAVLDGMTMVFKQLQDFLASSGVETIEATGEVFNPNLHEAIAQEYSDEFDEGVVVRQLRKGYKLKDRLIRPANVVVSKGKPVNETAAGASA